MAAIYNIPPRVLSASQAKRKASLARPVLLRKRIAQAIKHIEKDIKETIRQGGYSVQFDLCEDVRPHVEAHFIPHGYWVDAHEGHHQGGGMCLYYRLRWDGKPKPVVLSFLQRLFGTDSSRPKWNERF